jgi:hypothetical protein
MPNTLAHIGLQAPLTKIGCKAVPLQWIVLGCIIPDIPWILQRILLLVPGIDPINLRLYVVTQASLLFCCILSLAFALLTRKSGFIFLILAVNSILHLLLDACQTKWGNGVHLLAPFSWHTTNFAFFWPEHAASHILTIMGVATLLFTWQNAIQSDLLLRKPDKKKAICLILTLICYLTAPFFFANAAYNGDVHYSKTIHEKLDQAGKIIEIDRGNYTKETQTITAYTNETISLNNPPAVKTGTLSIRGTFDQKNKITITEYHEHKSHRDYASYAGLFLILLLWLHSLIHKENNQHHRISP